jgi:hypothetical protein
MANTVAELKNARLPVLPSWQNIPQAQAGRPSDGFHCETGQESGLTVITRNNLLNGAFAAISALILRSAPCSGVDR